MANPLDSLVQFHTDALGMRAHRQQVLASNIANADTPGYKARDIDFAQALKNALAPAASPSSAAAVPAGQLLRTNAAHLPGPRSSPYGEALYRTMLQPALDGNTVDMDVEQSQFADNAIHYEANLTFINMQLKSMTTAIQG